MDANSLGNWIYLGAWITAAVLVVGSILKIGEWIGGMKEFKSDTKPLLNEIRDKVNRIVGKLDSPVMEPGSPLKLTDLGESISEELGAKSWSKEKSEQVALLVKGTRPYKIQGFCFDAVKKTNKIALGLPDDFISDDMDSKIQDCAFNRGTSITNVYDVLAIELRDAVLEELEISISHIDLDK